MASSAVAVTASTVGSPRTRSRLAQARVRGPVPGARHPDVVRLVDDQKADPPARGEALRVEVEELRRREHDVERAVRKRRERLVALRQAASRR